MTTGNTVNLCAIYDSKVFSRVYNYALLNKLKKRLLPVKLLSFFENLLLNCHSCIKWKYPSLFTIHGRRINKQTYIYKQVKKHRKFCCSQFFKLEFIVTQSSVLSPLSFAIYLDDIVKSCNHTHVVHLVLYDDDILLRCQQSLSFNAKQY